MLKIDHQQILKRYYQLPRSLQEAMFSERSADTIGKTCVLREAEQHTSKIAALTGRVLLGYLRPETFAFEIQKETGMDALKATQVAHDIDTEIFSEVRLELKKLYPPTIQTPTVQSQGFAPREVGTEQKPRPYVVQIPERFKKTTSLPAQQVQSAPQQPQPTTDSSNPITQNEGIMHPAPAMTPIAEQKPTTPESPSPKPSTEKLSEQASPQPPTQKTPRPTSPPMDPIVPLPIFIQSKFKASDFGVEAGIKSSAAQPQPETQEKAPVAPSAQDALKNAFGKFTTSSTASSVIKESASPYREPLEEPKKPEEQKPIAKVQGKVIDLSQF